MAHDPVYNERLRLCRELHDGAVQDLIAALMTLRAMPVEHPPAVACRDDAIGAVERALQGARSLIRDIRSANDAPAADGGRGEPLAFVIDEFVRPVARAGGLRLRVDVEPGIAVLAAHVEDVGNILREVARNVVRHARAGKLEVTASRAGQAISVDVRDDGVGFATLDAGEGFGIAGIAERAALIGGAVVIRSRQGAGTRVQVMLPFPQVALGRTLRSARATVRPAAEPRPSARFVA